MAKSHFSKGSTFLATFDRPGNLVGWVPSHGNFYQKNLIKLVFFFTSLFLHSQESPWKEGILYAWHFEEEVGACVQSVSTVSGDGLEISIERRDWEMRPQLQG